jgi:molecular chaperone DnaJ
MTPAERDYYHVLGVSRDANAKTIKNAFRALALEHHPDRSREADAGERFKEIAEAYAVLSDPQRRAEYDRGGFTRLADFAAEDFFGSAGFADIFAGLGLDLGGRGLFEQLMGGRRPAAGPPPGENLEVLLEVSLERVLTGGDETVAVSRPERCPACDGSGAKAGTKPRPCERCGGSGRQVTTQSRSGISIQQATSCQACRGRGSFIDEPCPGCAGRGQAMRSERIRVRIPAGIEDGAALRVPGHGLASPVTGGGPGDLFVVVRTAPHSELARDGANLWRQETISIPDAVLGTRLRVPTLEQPATLSVPPGTQPGTVVVVPGSGLPAPGTDRRGDLRVRIDVPSRTASQRRSERSTSACAGSARRETLSHRAGAPTAAIRTESRLAAYRHALGDVPADLPRGEARRRGCGSSTPSAARQPAGEQPVDLVPVGPGDCPPLQVVHS